MAATNEARFSSDIPNERWLQEKREDAELSGRTDFGVPKAFGPCTGRFDKYLNVSIELLAVLPGQRGEQGSVRKDALAYLRANWDQACQEPLYVEIDPFGTPWVSEGNHRIMVAKEKGNLYLPTEVKYFGGGDRLGPDDWLPANLIAADLKLGGATELSMNNKSNKSIVEPQPVFDPLSPEGYAVVMADKSRQVYWQDRLDSFFWGRVVDVRNALRDAGWDGEHRSRVLTRGAVQIEFEPLQVGAGANVVGGSWRLLTTNNMKMPLKFRTIAELADVLTGTVADLAGEIDLMAIRETARITENGLRSPQELTFKDFSENATVVKLENHGRQWSVRFGDINLGFADGPSLEGALREAHSGAVNNAIYSHLPDAPDFMKKAIFPSEKVLAEYPELRVKFADVFEARDVLHGTQIILETVDTFISEHGDWWDDQMNSADGEAAKRELRKWRNSVMVPGEPEIAAKCLATFVGLVEGGRLEWLDASVPDCLENKLFGEAKSIVGKALGKVGSAIPMVMGDVVGEGSFSGKVLVVSGGVVTQKINRDGRTVLHDQSMLSKPVVVGEVVEIKYSEGLGVVASNEPSVGLER